MYKIYTQNAYWPKSRMPKVLRVMKIFTFLLIASILQVSASSFAQKITLNMKQTTLKKVFNEIRKQTGYDIVWSNKTVKSNTLVDANFKDVALSDVLTQCLKGKPLVFTVKDKTIVISEVLKQVEKPSTSVVEQLNIKVVGHVQDEKGLPLPGASVKIKGQPQGTTTDVDGNFSIEVPDAGAILQVSFLGYQAKEVAVKKAGRIVVQLQALDQNLSEVTVVGYGTKPKATLTGAVTTVTAAQLEGRPTTNVISNLQGIAPGLAVTRGNVGRIGRESDNLGIQVRGLTSRSGAGILIIVDGIIQESGELSGKSDASQLDNINPDDIESVTVLKDAQAAIYGSRASGGVMLITTKRGKSGKPLITLNASATLNTPGIRTEHTNILQTLKDLQDAYTNDGVPNNYWTAAYNYTQTHPIDLNQVTALPGPFPDTQDITASNNDWTKIMFGNAWQQFHTLSVSGTTDKSNYYVSLGLQDQHSMLQYGTNTNKKYNVRLKYDYDITNYLKFKTNISIQSGSLIEPTNYDLIENLTNYSFNGKAKYTPTGKYYGFGGYISTIGLAEKGGNDEEKSTETRTTFELVFNPIKNLTFTGQLALNRDVSDAFSQRLGFNSYTYEDVLIFNSNLYWGGKDQVNAAYARSSQTLANILGSYKYDLNKHHFDILAGASQEQNDYRTFSAYRQGDPFLLNNNIQSLGAGAVTAEFNAEQRAQTALQSLFGRFSYDFDKKYIFEGNARVDGTSKFAPGDKYSSFYGASAGWVLTNESFFESLKKYVNLAKLRVSYGLLGNQTGGLIQPYDYIQFINTGSQYPFGPINSPTRNLSTYVPKLASPDRHWEKIAVKNIGLDFGVLDNKLTGSFDYFNKENQNFFYVKEFPSVIGIQTPQINGAKSLTKGWELTLQWRSRIGRDFEYSIGGNITDNTNKVTSLTENGAAVPAQGINGYRVGYPSNSYFGYVYDGHIQDAQDLASYKSALSGGGILNNLRTGDTKFKDLNGDGKLTPLAYDPKNPSAGGDLQYLGNINQRYLYAINLGANWKGIYFSSILQGVGKWLVPDYNQAIAPFFRNPLLYHHGNTWTPENPNALYPKSSEDFGINGYNYQFSNAPYFLRSAAYLRLKNLQIGYNIPSVFTKKYGINSLRVYINASDLAEWSAIPRGFDPEKPFAVQSTPYPRVYSFGLNVSL